MKKVIVTHAVQKEFVPLNIDGCEFTYILTGIGKARAAMNLTEAICNRQPDLVLNIGTAGTLNHSLGDIFVCKRFIDRDFLSINLPEIIYDIDFAPTLENIELAQKITSNGNTGVCNTGDSFVTQAEDINGDIVDMEAFAQAVVCKKFGIPLVAVKYVTDVIGQNSVKHWEDKLNDARSALEQWFGKIK